MKKIINIGFLVAGFIFAIHSTTFAQSGDIKIGGGLIYGSEVESLGLKVDGYYSINEEFRVGAGIGYYFPDKTTIFGTEISTNYFAVDFNGNYIFYNEDKLMAYGLAGINILSVSVSAGGTSESTSEVGLNLGAGLEYMVDFGALFGELKFSGIGGDADQLVLDVGVRFPIQ